MKAPDETRLLLGIETSCDDTACAVLDGRGRVLASVVSSQLEAHRPFGGVVPEIASREHLANWPAVYSEALERAGVGIEKVGAVAATRGPGLMGALLVGLSLGKSLAYGRGVPFFAVHHLEGHLYSPFLALDGAPAAAIPERFVGLVVSGGHTNLFAVDGTDVANLAETRDDAMGEVFDKIGKRLGLPYPQGPHVDRLAEGGDGSAVPFKVATVDGDSLAFSYSGLKSQVLMAIERLEQRGVATDLSQTHRAPAEAAPSARPAGEVLDLLAAFRAAAVGQLIDRLDRLHDRRPFDHLALSGGVAANRLLRRQAAVWAETRRVTLHSVPLAYCGDNAAMIAFAALRRWHRGEADDPFDVEAASRIPFAEASVGA